MSLNKIGSGILIISIAAVAIGQNNVNGKCGELETAFKFAHPSGQPVIFGKQFDIRRLDLRFAEATGNGVAGSEVIVRYMWKWFEYPYQEHPTGVWSTAYNLIRCNTGTKGAIEVPEYKLVPAGWYKGPYLLGGRRPKFEELEISLIDSKGKSYTFHVSSAELVTARKLGVFRTTFTK